MARDEFVKLVDDLVSACTALNEKETDHE